MSDVPPKPVHLCSQADFAIGTGYWRRHPRYKYWQKLQYHGEFHQWYWSIVYSEELCILLNKYASLLPTKVDTKVRIGI